MQKSALPLSQQPFLLSKLQGYAVLAVIFSYVIDAPLRFGLSKIHASPFMYMRDAIAVMIVVAAFIHWFQGKKQNSSTAVMFILVVHMFIGVITLGSLFQPIAGFKLFFTLLLGIASYETIRQNENALIKFSTAAFILTCLGVLINLATDMPWAGETFDSALGDTSVSIEWTTGGVRRLAGFARASYDASTIAVTMSIPLLVCSNIKFLYRLLIIVVAFGIIFLTTTKGSILAMAVIAIFTTVFLKTQKPNRLNVAFFILPALALLIPSMLYAYGARLQIENSLWFIFSSFAERINIAWPLAFDLLKISGNVITGRGLGGIGFPQNFGEGSHFNAADNAMVYLFITFGVFSIIYIYTILMRLKSAAQDTSPYMWNCLIGWLIYWNIYGFTTNIIENPFFMFFVGLIIGAASGPSSSKPEQAALQLNPAN